MKNGGDVFAKNLRARRRELGYTQKELADLIGYTEKSVSKWESGYATTPSTVLPLLAKKLGVSIDYLFSDDGDTSYYLGIDGGGTKTEFALSDIDGRIISRAIFDGSNPVDIGIERTLEILSKGIATVCEGVPVSRISVFAGLSGGITGDFKAKIRAHLESYGFASAKNGSDSENATALALGDGDGIAVIMGTGSIALTKLGGELIRNGGYGYLFDDGGSGFALGRDAIIAALSAEEGRGEETLLLTLLKSKLGCERLIDSLGAFYKGGKRTVASFAPLIVEAYRNGDAVAEKIIDNNMRTVAGLIENAPRAARGKLHAVIVGGLTKDADILLPYIRKHIKNPEKYDISANTSAPIYGALMLAGAKIKEIK